MRLAAARAGIQLRSSRDSHRRWPAWCSIYSWEYGDYISLCVLLWLRVPNALGSASKPSRYAYARTAIDLVWGRSDEKDSDCGGAARRRLGPSGRGGRAGLLFGKGSGGGAGAAVPDQSDGGQFGLPTQRRLCRIRAPQSIRHSCLSKSDDRSLPARRVPPSAKRV